MIHTLLLIHFFLLSYATYLTPNTFTVTHLPEPGYIASIGNAFIGYDMGCPSTDESSSSGYLFTAGTYSGNGTTTPSHRALIPHRQAVYVHNISNGGILLANMTWTAMLDIQRAIYENTTTVEDNGVVCVISLSWIAHRMYKNASVLHISTNGSDDGCVFYLASCNGDNSSDVDLVLSKSEVMDGENLSASVYQTLLPEIPGGSLANVTLIGSVFPTSFSAGFEYTSILQVSSSVWGYQDETDLDYAMYQYMSYWADITWDSLLESHISAWQDIWRSGIEIQGNDTIAAAVNASLYAILSSVDAASTWSVSPGGLPKNSYNGHVFWDCETWMLPAIVPFHPNIAESFVKYRTLRSEAAMHRALERGYQGMMMPWESAYTGIDVTPDGNIEGDYEIHVTADIPLSMRLVYYWTQNEAWITNDEVWSVIVNCSEYFVSRVTCLSPTSEGDDCDLFSLMLVQPPDERAGIVNSSVYTNAAAADLLSWVGEDMSYLLPQHDGERYTSVADQMYIPVSNNLYSGPVHPEYEGYAGDPINQADAVLLQFPLLFAMPDQLAYNDLRYYENKTSVPGVTRGFYTGDSSYSIAYLALLRKGFTNTSGEDLRVMADDQFQQAFLHIDMKSFFVWREKVDGGHVNFITGAGGFLQNVIYGYAGLEANEDGLYLDYPILPPGSVEMVTMRGLRYAGALIDYSYDAGEMLLSIANGQLDIYGCMDGDSRLSCTFSFIATISSMDGESSVTLPLQYILVTAHSKNGHSSDDDIETVSYLPLFLSSAGCISLVLCTICFLFRPPSPATSWGLLYTPLAFICRCCIALIAAVLLTGDSYGTRTCGALLSVLLSLEWLLSIGFVIHSLRELLRNGGSSPDKVCDIYGICLCIICVFFDSLISLTLALHWKTKHVSQVSKSDDRSGLVSKRLDRHPLHGLLYTVRLLVLVCTVVTVSVYATYSLRWSTLFVVCVCFCLVDSLLLSARFIWGDLVLSRCISSTK